MNDNALLGASRILCLRQGMGELGHRAKSC
jgi:hypothetical protein